MTSDQARKIVAESGCEVRFNQDKDLVYLEGHFNIEEVLAVLHQMEIED